MKEFGQFTLENIKGFVYWEMKPTVANVLVYYGGQSCVRVIDISDIDYRFVPNRIKTIVSKLFQNPLSWFAK